MCEGPPDSVVAGYRRRMQKFAQFAEYHRILHFSENNALIVQPVNLIVHAELCKKFEKLLSCVLFALFAETKLCITLGTLFRAKMYCCVFVYESFKSDPKCG